MEDANINTAPDNISSGLHEIPKELISMIESLNKGEEPILLKIVSGNATEEEIAEWAGSNSISPDETSEILSLLISSFAAGTRLAEEIESDMAKEAKEMNEIARIVDQNNLDEFDKEKVLDQLDGILNRLDSIRKEVSTLIEDLQPTPIPTESDIDYDNCVYY